MQSLSQRGFDFLFLTQARAKMIWYSSITTSPLEKVVKAAEDVLLLPLLLLPCCRIPGMPRTQRGIMRSHSRGKGGDRFEDNYGRLFVCSVCLLGSRDMIRGSGGSFPPFPPLFLFWRETQNSKSEKKEKQADHGLTGGSTFDHDLSPPPLPTLP